MSYNGMVAGMVSIRGDQGDGIEAYYARPAGSGPFPGVVVIHHMPGFDEWICEATRKIAHNGYAAISPHLFFREGPGSPDDLAARARSAGGVADSQVMGDVAGASDFLRAQPEAGGKVGVIGFCSGGRHSYLAACLVPGLDAAVDCWGGRVVPERPDDVSEKRPIVAIDLTEKMRPPLLGLFGNDDTSPSPAAVDRIEAELKRLGKTYEFYRYDGAGHGFFAVDRPNYRWEQATDGWQKVFAFFGKYLKGA